MKKLNSAKLAFIMFSAMTAACVSGSIGGTLAWYAYSTRANVSYSGTSVNETSLLQIGICSDVAIAGMPSSVTQVTYPGDSNYYYFSDPGKGLTYDIIAKYLSKKGYATNEINPLTSGSFVDGDNQNSFGLKEAPNELVHGNSIEAAKNHYVKVPFVFRIQGNGESFYDGKELWLSKTVARASSVGDGEVYKALRVFIDRDERNYGDWKEITDVEIGTAVPEGDLGHAYYLKTDENKVYAYDNEHDSWNLIADVPVFVTEPDAIDYSDDDLYINSAESKLFVRTHKDFIISPSANSDGRTRVGGVLNRNRDDYYDYDNDGEILYGEYEPDALNLLSPTVYSGADEVDDVNGVGDDEPSTFVAKHHPDTKYYSNFGSVANDAKFKHAEYKTVSSIAPVRDMYDYLDNQDPSNPTSVCKTRADDNHLARVTMTVYLEGWDFSVVDKEISHGFDLGLTFEMSRL